MSESFLTDASRAKAGMGPRGDAVRSFDWSVGEIVKAVKKMKLQKNTIIIVTSE